MAVTIKLYETKSDRKQVTKELDLKMTTSCVLKEACSIERPTLLITTPTNISKYNYLYIEDFGRYYYIMDIVSVRNGLWEVSTQVDVLMSFANDIKQCTGIISRQESTDLNGYINDNTHVVQSNEFNRVFNFPSGFNSSGEYVLICAGG